MDLSALEILVGDLTNDPNHDRYSTTQIGIELDNSQDKWNAEAKILKDTVTLTVVDGTRQYDLTNLTGTPISFTRVTHKGLLLAKRDKPYFDLYYGGVDWTTTIGTPTDFFVEATDPAVQFLTLFPTPQSNDAGANLVVEYVKKHTTLSASSDTPFNALPLMRPYDYGLAYDVAARLLVRDPSEINAAKVGPYARIANGVMADVIQVFKALEKQIPLRLKSIYKPVGLTANSWRQAW